MRKKINVCMRSTGRTPVTVIKSGFTCDILVDNPKYHGRTDAAIAIDKKGKMYAIVKVKTSEHPYRWLGVQHRYITMCRDWKYKEKYIDSDPNLCALVDYSINYN